MSNIVKYIYNLAIKENIYFHILWFPKILDESIGISGEYDVPANQYQNLFTLNLNKTGNISIIDIPGSGKENLLVTLIYLLCIYYSPNELILYIF